MNTFLLDMIP